MDTNIHYWFSGTYLCSSGDAERVHRIQKEIQSSIKANNETYKGADDHQ